MRSELTLSNLQAGASASFSAVLTGYKVSLDQLMTLVDELELQLVASGATTGNLLSAFVPELCTSC
jgi:hypothetical protein